MTHTPSKKLPTVHTNLTNNKTHNQYEKNLNLLKNSIANSKTTTFFNLEHTKTPNEIQKLVDDKKIEVTQSLYNESPDGVNIGIHVFKDGRLKVISSRFVQFPTGSLYSTDINEVKNKKKSKLLGIY